MKRYFIAINFPKGLKNRLFAFQRELSNYLPSARWVKPKNLHLTLVFLGRLDEKKLNKVTEILYEAMQETSPLSLRIKDLGVFPNPKRIRVLWVDTEKDVLRLLNQALYRKLTKAGFSLDERDFSPHITLARFKDKINKNAILSVLEKFKEVDFGKIEIKSIELMQSTLKRQGPEYNVVESIKLG